MYIAFLIVLLIIALVPAVDAFIEQRKKKKDADAPEKKRTKEYLQSMAFLWGGVLAVFIMCLAGGISPGDIGLRPLYFEYNIWITAITMVLWGLTCIFFIFQTILPIISAKQREEAEKKLANDKREGAIDMIPRTKKEKRLFVFLSLSAGICEEILYRGFMVFLLITLFPGIPVYLIILIPSVLFGIGHFYQGVQGVVTTGAYGAVFMWIYLVSGSLIPCIVLHFLADFSSTFLLSGPESESELL